MQRYSNSVQDANGNAITNATVTVRTYLGATPTIYSDNGVTVAANPLSVDSSGQYYFYAANGRYTLSIAATNFIGETLSDVMLFESSDVANYGVKGDGVTDDTVALELACTSAGTNAVITIPPGFNCLVSSEVDFNVAGQRWICYGAKITKNATFTGSCVVRIGATDVTIEGLEIDGTDQADDGIITSASVAAGFTARKLKVYNCLYGISANSNSRVLIENCDIDACASYPIRVHNIAGGVVNDDLRVVNNRLDQRDQVAATSTNPCLLVRGDESFPSTNVHVDGNTMYHVSDPTNSSALGCEFRFVDGGTFANNICTGGGMLVSIAASKNCQVDGNTAIGQTFWAIEVASISTSICADVSVTGNTIRGSGLLNYAVGLQGTVAGCVGCTVSGNTISGVLKYGVFSNDVWDKLSITGNTIRFTDADTSQYGIYLLGSTTRSIQDVTIAGNLVDGGSVGEKAIFLLNVTQASVTGNVCPGWSEHGVYISVSATVTVDDIAISGNMLTPNGANGIGKSVSGTMGGRVTARANSGFRLTNTVNTEILNYNLDVYEAWGTATPEAAVTAGVSSIFHRSDGGAGTCIYIKETGTGDTGWVAK